MGSAGDPHHRVTRTSGARVYVRNEYVMRPGAVVANGSMTFYGPITTSGDVYASKVMGIKSGTLTPAINGAGYSQSSILVTGYIQPRDK